MEEGERATLKQFNIELQLVQKRWDEMQMEHFFKLHMNAILNKITQDDASEVRTFFAVGIAYGGSLIVKYGEQILQRRSLLKWKDHTEIFDTILESYMNAGDYPKGRYCPNFTSKLIALLKALNMCDKYIDTFFVILEKAFATLENRYVDAVPVITENIPWKKYPERIDALANRTYEVMDQNPNLTNKIRWAYACHVLWLYLPRSIKESDRDVAIAIAPKMAKLFWLCVDREWYDVDNMEKRNLNHQVLEALICSYYQCHHKVTEVMRPVFKKIVELRDCDDKVIQREAKNLYNRMGENLTELLDDNVDLLIQDFMNDPTSYKIYQMQQAYKGNSQAFLTKLNELTLALCQHGDKEAAGLHFIWALAKEHPKEFSKESLKAIVDTITLENANGIGLTILSELAATRSKELHQYDDILIQGMNQFHVMAIQACQLLVRWTKYGKKYAVKYIQVVVQLSKDCPSNYAASFIQNLKLIGYDYPEVLAKYRAYFEELLDVPTLKEQAQGVIDVIEGRSLKTIADEVSDQRTDINQLDNRVTVTETRVDGLEEDVGVLNEDVADLKTEVVEQGDRLGDLEVVVEETVDKVEEIDQKTLSHAPVWSRDVARLMNHKHDYDWRFLATKLGYSNDDIRNWATQPDPCLSLLDEWFATHKTRDATFAVEQALNDMNRTDAAMIVENALKQTEDTVDDNEDETWDPPPIFISYQWAHQQEVKLLHKHLEMAGYKSWMDIGQMGGGDKLFEKIDRGIRAAKVVICCVSEKYAKSPNCNREVTLAVTLGKPMIPLLMEKQSWPPPGSMGPIFGEYIFVRFFARPGETAGDDRYWPTAKFQELLMQLRYTHAPNILLITSDLYAEWWNPPEEIVTIKTKDATKTPVANPSNAIEDISSASPEIFISYQWDKQPQIKKLYQTLTGYGYSCWLDIMQMGGGDSLYDKIDKGIRGCKVVISCVTPKYALSANCRREVSLADAIKKPIIPLLLETIMWPPAGPMSMVFAQLVYIDFCEPDVGVQNHWRCEQMEELSCKLKEFIPRRMGDIIMDNGTSKATKKDVLANINENAKSGDNDIDAGLSTKQSLKSGVSDNDLVLANEKKMRLKTLNVRIQEKQFTEDTEHHNSQPPQLDKGQNTATNQDQALTFKEPQKDTKANKKSSTCILL